MIFFIDAETRLAVRDARRNATVASTAGGREGTPSASGGSAGAASEYAGAAICSAITTMASLHRSDRALAWS